jgi:hypothetical protein
MSGDEISSEEKIISLVPLEKEYAVVLSSASALVSGKAKRVMNKLRHIDPGMERIFSLRTYLTPKVLDLLFPDELPEEFLNPFVEIDVFSGYGLRPTLSNIPQKHFRVIHGSEARNIIRALVEPWKTI